MEKDTVIKVENLSKKFCRSLKRSMFYGSLDVAKNMLGIEVDTEKLRKDEFWALDDISFELKKGEALGIIGQNGSGKTTLLRLLNGIFPPDKGKISLRGKMGALIAVGAGFHPHMTGRENIFLNGTILGMKKEEIKRKYHEIVDFADIGKFIDAPVATYSSGMTVRLGFSIAIHCTPEILLADEVLAVGDLQFVLKCFRKITEYKKRGGSIILVSHGMQLVRNTCKNTLWIDKGMVKKSGETQKVCDEYENYMLKKDSMYAEKGEIGVMNFDSQFRLTKIEFLNDEATESDVFNVGDRFKVRIRYVCRREISKPVFTITLYSPENIAVVSNHSTESLYLDSLPKGAGHMDFSINNLGLKPSRYSCSVTVSEFEISNHLETHEKSHTFIVKHGKFENYGLYNPFPLWELSK